MRRPIYEIETIQIPSHPDRTELEANTNRVKSPSDMSLIGCRRLRTHFVQQRLGLTQIGRVVALCESVIDRSE
jgi:hypothetical protein